MTPNRRVRLEKSVVDRIMDEWSEITSDTRANLRGDNPRNVAAERELDILLTVIIPGCFRFGYGAEPTDLEESQNIDNSDTEGNSHYLWNYPRFAQIFYERASNRRNPIATRKLIESAFNPPKFDDHPEDTPIQILKRKLNRGDGRLMMLKAILGDVELKRIENEKIFNTEDNENLMKALSKISKRRKPDPSPDPEELKSIVQLAPERS